MTSLANIGTSRMLTDPSLASSPLLSILQHLQVVPNPREYLRRNAAQYCLVLNVPANHDNMENLIQFLEALLDPVGKPTIIQKKHLCPDYLDPGKSVSSAREPMMYSCHGASSMASCHTDNGNSLAYPIPHPTSTYTNSLNTVSGNNLLNTLKHENPLNVSHSVPLYSRVESYQPSNYYSSFFHLDISPSNSSSQTNNFLNPGPDLSILHNNFSSVSLGVSCETQDKLENKMQNFPLFLQNPTATTSTATVSTTPPSPSSLSSISTHDVSHKVNFHDSLHHNSNHHPNLMTGYSMSDTSYDLTKTEETSVTPSRYLIEHLGDSCVHFNKNIPRSHDQSNDWCNSVPDANETALNDITVNGKQAITLEKRQSLPKESGGETEKPPEKLVQLEDLINEFTLEEKVYLTQSLSNCSMAFFQLYTMLQRLSQRNSFAGQSTDSVKQSEESVNERNRTKNKQDPNISCPVSKDRHPQELLRLFDRLKDTVVAFFKTCPTKAFVFFSVLILREFQLFQSSFQSTNGNNESCLFFTTSTLNELLLGNDIRLSGRNSYDPLSVSEKTPDTPPDAWKRRCPSSRSSTFYETSITRSPDTEDTGETFQRRTKRRRRKHLAQCTKNEVLTQHKPHSSISTGTPSHNSLGLSTVQPSETYALKQERLETSKKSNESSQTISPTSGEVATPSPDTLDALCIENQIMHRIPPHLYRDIPARCSNSPIRNSTNKQSTSSSKNQKLSDIKSTVSSSTYAPSVKRVFAKDELLLQMPNHIITRTGVVLPPPDSGLYLSKVVGVVWDKIHNSWVVNYTLLGRRYFQHFPAKKYGFLEGRKLAIELRLAKDNEKSLVEGNIRGGGKRAQGPKKQDSTLESQRSTPLRVDTVNCDSLKESEFNCTQSYENQHGTNSDVTVADSEGTSHITLKNCKSQMKSTSYPDDSSPQDAFLTTYSEEYQEQKQPQLCKMKKLEHQHYFPVNGDTQAVTSSQSDQNASINTTSSKSSNLSSPHFSALSHDVNQINSQMISHMSGHQPFHYPASSPSQVFQTYSLPLNNTSNLVSPTYNPFAPQNFLQSYKMSSPQCSGTPTNHFLNKVANEQLLSSPSSENADPFKSPNPSSTNQQIIHPKHPLPEYTQQIIPQLHMSEDKHESGPACLSSNSPEDVVK